MSYIHYRVYVEDGAVPLKNPFTPDDPFLGRIDVLSVAPPRNVKLVKRKIAKDENIIGSTITSLFRSPSFQLPMDDADKIIIKNGISPGSTPQEPLAIVRKMSDQERSDLESGQRSGLATAESGTTPANIRYVYYTFYIDDDRMPSKAVFDPNKPFLRRIRADFIAPPHSLASVKLCLSRVERKPVHIWYAELYDDSTLLTDGPISFLLTSGPGLSPTEPIEVSLKTPSIADGKYAIKNRATDIYWKAAFNSIKMVYFYSGGTKFFRDDKSFQWDITHDTDGILITSMYNRSPTPWVSAELTESTVPVPWRLIPAPSKFFYLTSDTNRDSQNPRVAAAQSKDSASVPGTMATLNEGDQQQMWEFIPIL